MAPKHRPYVRRRDLLYPELSYQINGVLFDVAKELGGGHQERYYQKAVAQGFTTAGLQFRQQVYVPLTYQGQSVGKYYLDFLVEGTVVVELKRGEFVSVRLIEQTVQYLSALHLRLAIVACFTHGGVVVKSVVHDL